MTRTGLFAAIAVAFAFTVAALACSAEADVEPRVPGADASAAHGDGGAAPSDASGGHDGEGSAIGDGGSNRDGALGLEAAPPQLLCLASHFAGSVVVLAEVADSGQPGPGYDASTDDAAPLEPAHAASRYGLLLDSGMVLPWDDGKAKSYEHTLAEPDLQDMLLMPYSAGPIAPVQTVNVDPGRIRSDELFKAAYGASASAVEARLDDVEFVGQSVTFHERASGALRRVADRLDTLIAGDATLRKYVTGTLGGTYEWRPILNTNRLSVHSYGAAIDIRVQYSNYWEWAGAGFAWENQIPQAVVDAFEAEMFVWGGRWYHYDTMHFEYRPELFDPACKL